MITTSRKQGDVILVDAIKDANSTTEEDTVPNLI